jgi:DNA-directed RNA polymerase specialized sigma24 family protein
LTEDTLLLNQADLLYRAASKQLYNFALYAVGDQRAAEQITENAFADAFLRVPDRSDIRQFYIRCLKLLCRYGRKLRKKTAYCMDEIIPPTANRQASIEKKCSLQLLRKLSYDQRCIFLLFCWRIPITQIASITGLPVFMTRRRLSAVINKAMKLREN